MDKVNFRQLICLTFLIAIAMKMFMLPVLMMRVSGRDSFISLIIMLAIDFVFLFVVCVVLHLSEDKNIFELLSSAFGSVAAKIILITVGLFYFIKLFMILIDVRVFFSTSVFSSTMSPVHLIPLVLLMAYFAFKPLCTAGRISEIITPIVVVSMLLLCCMTLPEVDFSYLFPLGQEGVEKIAMSCYSFALWFGDFSILLAFTGKTAKTGKKAYFALIPALVGFVFLVVFSTTLFASYGDMTEVLTYGHNISNMTQYGAGSFKFGSINTVIYTMWLSAVLLSAGLMTTFMSHTMTYVFGYKCGKLLTLAGLTGIFVLSLIFAELNRVIEVMTACFWLPSIIVQYSLPMIAVAAIAVNKFKENKAYDKTEQKA